jgi:lyso-ornithine lipid O-acyltransferase
LRVTLKSARLILHLLIGLVLAGLIKIDRGSRLPRERMGTWWHRILLRILDVRLSTRGTAVAGSRVFVCNHISWLDIPVVGACEPVRFVSKAEIQYWPIAGWLANAAGTFYLRRGAGSTKQLIASIDAHLGHGTIVFFPEGTTTDGKTVLKFQPRLFACAIETGRAVQPVALRYGNAANGLVTAPFIGDDDMVSHLIRLIKNGPITAELIYCPPIDPAGYDRAGLAEAAHTAICTCIAPAAIGTSELPKRREQTAPTRSGFRGMV